MGSITAVDTLKLSISERIVLVEEIWDTIAAEVDAIEFTEDEKKLIDQRLEAYRQHPEAVSSWEAVYKRLDPSYSRREANC
jgi:putative addiction module component (TIGR02574 family)